jgi:hypothetical protein
MLVADLFKSRWRVEAENLFLRHQLNIVLRSAPPRAPSGTFHHWGLYNLQTRGVPEGFASADRQDDIESAINDFGVPSYRGPAPPPGHGTHHGASDQSSGGEMSSPSAAPSHCRPQGLA